MELADALEIVSYKIGLRFGETVLNDELYLNDKILEAIEDKKNGTEKKFDLKLYMKATQIVSAERTRLSQVKNQQFLIENAKAEGIQQTASGLQYKVLTEGTGDAPKSDDQVTVHYTGKLICGTDFDSSVERGEPATFQVNKVIAGWTEALQLMQPGAKWMLYIPENLGYGDRGVGSDIPPFATLVFEVELLKVG